MNRLKEIRKEHKLKQKDIANKLKISQNGYSQYENGKRDISTVLLRKFAILFNTSIDYILLNSDSSKKYPKSSITESTTILNRLKEIREDKDLNQSDVAKYLNINKSAYVEYEIYRNDIPTSILIKLAKFYNVSIDYLLYMTDERKPYKKN